MKFIALTSTNNNKIRVNMDLIESYGTITEKTYTGADKYIGKTFLCYQGMKEDDTPYIVEETPEQIDNLLEIAELISAELMEDHEKRETEADNESV